MLAHLLVPLPCVHHCVGHLHGKISGEDARRQLAEEEEHFGQIELSTDD